MIRTIGSAQAVSSHSRTSSPSVRYRSSCIVKADGQTPLVAIAELGDNGDFKAWEESLAANGDLGPSGERKEFTVSSKGRGVSATRSAAIYLKCDPVDSKIQVPLNLSITVSGTKRGPSTRADLAEVALSFAKYAQSSAHCSDPASLPAGPPNQLRE
ncbi:hypothetical protein HEK131_46630 [Streptomyces seoulensis]|nr:hypothetical protein HEK131_46630 [Streptomyces seoulensis]